MSNVKGSSVPSIKDLGFTDLRFDLGNIAVAKILWALHVVAKLYPKYSALKLKKWGGWCRYFWYMTCIPPLSLLLPVKFLGIVGKVTMNVSTVNREIVNRKQ